MSAGHAPGRTLHVVYVHMVSVTLAPVTNRRVSNGLGASIIDGRAPNIRRTRTLFCVIVGRQ